MTNTDRKTLSGLLKRCGNVFGKEVTPELVETYFEALRHLPIDSVEHAIRQLVPISQFFPKPVEIIERSKPEDPWPKPREIDGEPTYQCPKCQDQGVILRQTPVACMATPCECRTGGRVRQSWDKPSDHDGNRVSDTARDNARRLDERLSGRQVQREAPEGPSLAEEFAALRGKKFRTMDDDKPGRG